MRSDWAMLRMSSPRRRRAARSSAPTDSASSGTSLVISLRCSRRRGSDPLSPVGSMVTLFIYPGSSRVEPSQYLQDPRPRRTTMGTCFQPALPPAQPKRTNTQLQSIVENKTNLLTNRNLSLPQLHDPSRFFHDCERDGCNLNRTPSIQIAIIPVRR